MADICELVVRFISSDGNWAEKSFEKGCLVTYRVRAMVIPMVIAAPASEMTKMRDTRYTCPSILLRRRFVTPR